MSNLLIAGCGYVGTELGQRLSSDGHTVHGLRRNPENLPEALEPIRADLTRPGDLTDLPDDLDYVFYTASASGRGASAYRPIYVDGLSNLIDGLADRDLKRFLYTSSTAVYGQQNGEWVDETSPTEPGRERGRILLEAEDLVLSGPFPGTVVRFGGIYGPGRARYIRHVRSGRATCYQGIKKYTNKNHLVDCARTLEHLMTYDDGNEVYNGTDPNPSVRCDILKWLARKLDAPEPGEEPLDNASSRIRTTNKRIQDDKLLETGYEFTYPSYKEGYGALLDD